ncbi:hypothetical protein GCM10027456_35920 [Kineosporia babensis]
MGRPAIARRKYVVRHRGRSRRITNGTACCLPSGLSPSVLEFHQVNRPPTFSGRVADCYRRLGISPTPEHALLVLLVFAFGEPHGCGAAELANSVPPNLVPGNVKFSLVPREKALG